MLIILGHCKTLDVKYSKQFLKFYNNKHAQYEGMKKKCYIKHDCQQSMSDATFTREQTIHDYIYCRCCW